MNKYILEVERNTEGHNLAYLSKEGDSGGFRIAGPKAWGGSTNLARLMISESDLIRFIKEYTPEIIEKLSTNNFNRKTKRNRKWVNYTSY